MKGETALHIASDRGHLEFVEHLIAKEADHNLKDNDDKTAYDHALDKSIEMSEYEKFIKVMNFLLPLCTNRADPNLRNENGETALHRASYWGKLGVVKHLIANGAYPDIKDNNGMTAYDHAKNGIAICYTTSEEEENYKVCNER